MAVALEVEQAEVAQDLELLADFGADWSPSCKPTYLSAENAGIGRLWRSNREETRFVLEFQSRIRNTASNAYERLVAHVNRKLWWHVPPVDPYAYIKRGKFLASSFGEAELWGRPLDEPLSVTIRKPLIGDERAISRVLGIPPQHDGMTLKQIAAHDALWRNAALKKGFDAIVLMAPKCFAEWKADAKIPRSIELNIVKVA